MLPLQEWRERDVTSPEMCEEAAYSALRDNKFNICFTDSLHIDVGFGKEMVYSLLDVTPASQSRLSDNVELLRYQLINHSPHSEALTNKANFIRALNKTYTGSRRHVFDSIPTTYYLAGGTHNEADSPVLQQFIRRFNGGAHGRLEGERMPAKLCIQNTWIVKPAKCNSAAKILVSSSLGDIKAHALRSTTDLVIQKCKLQSALLLFQTG
jgi:hypothetical protein